MKKLVILILVAVLLTSCELQELGVDSNIEPTESTVSSGYWPHFQSEDEFIEYVLNESSEMPTELSANSEGNSSRITHYYRLKNPPLGASVSGISLAGEVTILYDTHEFEADGRREWLNIRYAPNWSVDIETDGDWRHRPFSDESYVYELDGIKYYVAKWTADGGTILCWGAEWINEDGYYMKALFPYRFTPEEVLGYISNIERVDIIPPGGGTQYATE
jgi:hypothetical protein